MTASANTRQQIHDAELTLGGERLVLRADHSVHWPAGDTLFVADTHFGKAGVFRRQGVNVPCGTTKTDLSRLTRALVETAAKRLIVLGDFVHAPPAGNESWLSRFADWRAVHPNVTMLVTRGNHDRVHQLPVDLGIEWQAGAQPVGPFVAQHEPGVDARGPVLCGHIHPVVRLVAGAERMRSPVFWLSQEGFVLPAFCGFAGGGEIAPSTGDRVFVVGAGEVIEIELG